MRVYNNNNNNLNFSKLYQYGRSSFNGKFEYHAKQRDGQDGQNKLKMYRLGPVYSSAR